MISKTDVARPSVRLLNILYAIPQPECPCAIGGAVAQSGELATPGMEVPGSIPGVAARFLLVGSVSV